MPTEKAEKKTATKTAVKKDKPVAVKQTVAAPKPEIKEEEVQMPLIVSRTVNPDDELDEALAAELAQSLKAATSDRYMEAMGRRKTATARVRMSTKGDKEFIVNDKPYTEYFATLADRENAVASMKRMKCLDKFRVTVVVKGGGHSAQAEAIRHGTARVLVDFNANFRKRLRKAGYLTRDPRARERKKFGLKRARKAPQWSKR
jgi:small subunit ribosomal protein S9